MANLEIKSPPEFTDEIYKTEREDLLTAELENDIKGKLLNNDVFLRHTLQGEKERAQEAEGNLAEKLQKESTRAAAAEKVLTENLQKEVDRATAAEETNKNNLVAHTADKSNPHKVTKAQVGLGNVNNTSDVNKPVSTAQQNAIDSAYQQATGYTDAKIADLIGGAPETLDTLKEVADAIQANKDVSTALDAAIGKKANQAELDTHTRNNTIHITSTERTNWNDANTKKHTHSNKSVLDKITQTLLDNWNAAKTHADSAHARTDATKTEKSNTNGNIKINGAETTVYTHPTTAGNKHIPAGGSSGQILRWSAAGTAVWGDDNDTKVTQQNTTANADTRVLLSNNANSTTETGGVKKSDNILFNPAKGDLYVKGYRRIDITGQTLDINTLTLSEGYPNIVRYIERSDGGATNIKNIPIPGKPFLLDVEMIRWATSTDYITMQTFRNASDYSHEYVRICTNGTWSAWQKRIFTDTNTTYSVATQSANGLMSSIDKKKLDGIAEGANKITVDSALNDNSTNPVQNKIVKVALDGKAPNSHTHNYAGSNSAGGGANRLHLPRVTKSASYQPGANTMIVEEFSAGSGYDLPTSHWYHIFTGQGEDSKYNTQLALGMTNQAVYYRYRNNGSWGNWKQLAFTDGAVAAAAKVKVTAHAPSTGTWYRVPFTSQADTGNGDLYQNDGFMYHIQQGTASATGLALLRLGNNVAAGTANNKVGKLRLYNAKAGCTDVQCVDSNDNYTIQFPAANGIVALANHTHDSLEIRTLKGKVAWSQTEKYFTLDSVVRFRGSLFAPDDGYNDYSNLGAEGYEWKTIYGKDIYANTLYEGETALSNKYAAKSHSHNYMPQDLAVRRVRRVDSGTTIAIILPFATGGGIAEPLDYVEIYAAIAGYGVTRGRISASSSGLQIVWEVNSGYINYMSLIESKSSSASTYTYTLKRTAGFSKSAYMQIEYTHGITDVNVS